MKKVVLLLLPLAFACSKAPSTYDKVVLAAKAHLNNKPVEFGGLDSLTSYPDEVLRLMAETQRLLLAGQDTVKNKHVSDSLQKLPKTKYYIINYKDKQANSPQMLVMDTAFNIKTTN